jgi:HSP20 family protein
MSALTTRPYGIDDFFPELFFRRLTRPFEIAPAISGEIKIDITENDKDYEVRAEIPGAKKEDIRISVDSNFVSISAEARKEKEEKSKGGRVLVRETSYGAVSRGFSLSSEIDDKGVVAKLDDGILKLTLPKREGAKARRIEVQ